MVRVLFIEGDPQAQATLAMILDGRYTVLPAYSTAEGLRELHDKDPDVVLQDIDPPNRDGLFLLEDIVSSPLRAAGDHAHCLMILSFWKDDQPKLFGSHYPR